MSNEITRILESMAGGDKLAANELFPLVYDELRRLANAKMKQEKSGLTLQPTALVHEAFLRLVGAGDWQKWDGRGHFFSAAAEAMRRILIENARRRKRVKRGGEMNRVDMDQELISDSENFEALLELDAALAKLELEDPELVKIVELRYFTGLTVEQTADVLGISERTVKRHWAYARAWLQSEIQGAQSFE